MLTTRGHNPRAANHATPMLLALAKEGLSDYQGEHLLLIAEDPELSAGNERWTEDRYREWLERAVQECGQSQGFWTKGRELAAECLFNAMDLRDDGYLSLEDFVALVKKVDPDATPQDVERVIKDVGATEGAMRMGHLKAWVSSGRIRWCRPVVPWTGLSSPLGHVGGWWRFFSGPCGLRSIDNGSQLGSKQIDPTHHVDEK